MKQVFLSTTTEFKEIETLEPGSWINLVNPSQSESMEIASAFNIDIADLRAPLDAEEMSRMTIEDEYTLIIVDVPIKEERNNQTYYVTIPLGIILTEGAIITTCLEKLPLLDIFINRRLRNFYTFMRSRFIFQILYRNAELYLSALRTLDRKSEQIESQLHKSTRNEELIELMELEKTIVYFKASLKTNERVIKKLTSATSNIKKYLEDEGSVGRYLDRNPAGHRDGRYLWKYPALHDRYLRINHLQQPEQHHEDPGPRHHCHVHSDHDLFGLRDELQGQ